MNRLPPANQSRVREFVSITKLPEKEATEYLVEAKWDLKRALNTYCDKNPSGNGAKPPDPKKLDAFFKEYANTEGDCIVLEGTLRLFADIEVEAVDPVALVIAYHCGAKDMGSFTRAEFQRGMRHIGAGCAADLKKRVENLSDELKSKENCKPIYLFTFNYAVEPPSKNLAQEMCVEYWRMLLPEHFPRLDDFIEFVQQDPKKRPISKDTWNMIWDFATTVKPDMSDYDFDGAWPVLLDEFVEWYRNRSTTSTSPVQDST